MNRALPLDVFTCPLDGISLIEASAGTGKTWNLCGLVMRLLLERGLGIQQILVVTFTNAATAELRDRIRQRIAGTLDHLRGSGATAAGDPFVPRLVHTLRHSQGLADADMVTRLELALASFDEAAIFTIHSFCQRALADTPFTAQMPLRMELLQDDSELVQSAANDFWRRRVAGEGLSPLLAASLLQHKDTPEKFARLLTRHLAKSTALAWWPLDIDHGGEPDSTAFCSAHAAARALWLAQQPAIVAAVLAGLPALNANSYKTSSVATATLGWDRVLQDKNAEAALGDEPDKIDLFGSTRLRHGCKKQQSPPVHPFFDVAQAWLDARAALARATQLARLRLLRDLLTGASAALRDDKRQRRVLAFDDMLFNLHQRLTGPDSAGLAAALRARFPAALIDEFQDTDPLQFAIFKAIYGSGAQHQHPLFLVGDPKQAIYSFRNADLPTYLQARAQASAEYTLLDNQRSSGPLLAALNRFFGANPQAFMLAGLDYRAVGLGDKPRQPLVDHSAPQAAAPAPAALQVWTLPPDPDTGLPLHKAQARALVAQATAAEIARLLHAAQAGQVTLGGAALRAGDVAVLVRSHAEGSLARQALSALGIGSVELSQMSVFCSPDAEDADRLLAAVLEPTRTSLLMAALASPTMGLNAAAIAALAADEAALLDTLQRFAGYRDTWLQRGVGVMLRQWLAAERVAQRLLSRDDGQRRLTNVLHLIECLHQAAADHPAPDALLRWLQAQRRDERAVDATQLRLESDQNLVQIVTVHKAKGLEFPIVFCPFLWNGRLGGFPDGLDGIEYHDDAGQAVIDYRKGLDGEFNEASVKARRKLDASAEALRLIYVALTRAVHRCVMVAGSYGTGKTRSATESAHSLLNWLAAGAGQSPTGWFGHKNSATTVMAAWDDLAAAGAPDVSVLPLPTGAGTALPSQQAAPDMLAALPPPQSLPVGWWIGSYSGLVTDARGGPTSAPTGRPQGEADTVGPQDAMAADHDLRVDVDEAPAALTAVRVDYGNADDDILRFPRGAAAGVCLHSVFEHADFTDAEHWPAAIHAALQALRPSLPESADAGAAQDDPATALHTRMLQRLLTDVLNTPLPVGTAQPLRLSALPLARRLTELEFHLPAFQLDAGALNRLLAQHGYAVPELAFNPLRGYLKGFIDLVFEHDGRYFILDWKSNHLGDRPADYGPAPLAAAMAEHAYHLQYLLYSVALDRHLRQRLPGYQPEQHFGGVLYLFVRGVRPGWLDADGQPTGLFFHRPAPATVSQLSALFNAPEATL